MWWVGKEGYAAFGSDGQRLYVMPRRNLVVVHAVDSDEIDRDVRSNDIHTLLRKILAAKQTLRPDVDERRGASR